MDGDSGALVLFIVLIVSAFLLIVLKLAQFVRNFSRKKQYLLNKMHRAADYNEYRYWLRELRCLYLCLIPFVTEQNVMKVYPVFFHRAKHATKEKRSDGFMHPRPLNACYLRLRHLPLRCKLGVVYRFNLNGNIDTKARPISCCIRSVKIPPRPSLAKPEQLIR